MWKLCVRAATTVSYGRRKGSGPNRQVFQILEIHDTSIKSDNNQNPH